MRSYSLEINRAIAEIENIKPANNLITCYKDFLKHRDFIHYYGYNVSVVISLIDLAYSLWHANERISRSSLIAVTKRYFKKSETKSNIPARTATKIFELFKEIVCYENLQLSKESLYDTKKAINSIMIGVKLKEKELQWLCDHSNQSEFIINRLLRYHLKSKAISDWAQKNFEKDFARSRRSEITSWIIDKNPNFKIDKETIEYDFEYQIIEDKKLVEIFKNEMDAYRTIEKELRPVLTTEDDSFFDDDGYEYKLKIQEKPILILPRKNYGVSIKMNSGYGFDIPDFDLTSKNFYDEFDNYYTRVMAWSIGYSRLSIDNKIRLLSKYYSTETYTTFFTIGKKIKSVQYFNWLKQMVN